MRIVKIVAGGMVLYALVILGVQSLREVISGGSVSNTSISQQVVVHGGHTTEPKLEQELSFIEVPTDPSPELIALSVELASQTAAVGKTNRGLQKKATSTATTTPPVAAPCSLGNIVIQSGQSAVFFSATSVESPNTCTALSQVRMCTSGVLSGSSLYQYPMCTVTVMPPIAAKKKLWGAFVGHSYEASALVDFEARIGAPVDLQSVFIGWGAGAGDFPKLLAAPLKGTGKKLLIFWEPSVNYDEINSGLWDSYMRSFALSIKTYGDPVMLAPFHEMNGDWEIWGGTVGINSPAKMIEAWKRMHGIFAAAGVTNVQWSWVVNNDSLPNIPANAIEKYYPGSEYVDIVGIDGFNFNDSHGWQTFAQVFDTPLAKVKAYGKPIYIASFASTADPRKAQWITDALTVQMYKHPEIEGWIWFNENKEKNWLIWSDPASLAAFQAAVR